MLKSHNSNSRVVFQKGKQCQFINSVQIKLNLSFKELAESVHINRRTLFYWKQEKTSMTLSGLRKLCRKANTSVPKDIQIKEPFWYTKKAGLKGWDAIKRKYGKIQIDPKYREKKWQEWWDQEGKFNLNKILTPLPFHIPRPSNDLAEFFGIMMGDGGITKTQITITLHHLDDLLYSKYVVKLIKKIFKVQPSVLHYPKRSVNNIVVSRGGLVSYLHTMGLPIGNKIKQGLDMPIWIKRDPSYQINCVRGLVDTDGCIFINRYISHNKMYAYKKLAFTTMSTPLRESVFDVLKKLGMNPQISQNRDVRLNNTVDMKKYFKIIGSHNPKHLKKWKNNKNMLE